MKPILPSLKEKKRYVVFEVKSKNKIKFDSVKSEIFSVTNKMLGEFETSKAGLMFLDDWSGQRGILRVNHTYMDKLKASLLFVKDINKYDVIIQSRGVSGILKKARNKFLYN
tara:strand:+ start:2484 stop:2819 length:336 start_codon:yes stop_codon:yes gene_type:complete